MNISCIFSSYSNKFVTSLLQRNLLQTGTQRTRGCTKREFLRELGRVEMLREGFDVKCISHLEVQSGSY